ncbi:MAG TPA: class I SAM-dependent methyltransferase [Anaerolineales bacterium]|nr:class I SAM-dependent methyltransferase [Anaerolineales bacterium]HLO30386.1 class I SAM-dependent methyltransferase [Anaerolineales bacterium]
MSRKQLRQTIQNLKGEVEFREKLSRQHVLGESRLPDYYQKEQHDQILLQRMHDTRQKMEQLKNQGVGLSPFLELGAERGQRSLVLANDFNATGIAIDISYHQLKTMDHFSKLFHKERMPVRICCDANHLPFRNNSFPFVFCYEFLHHFPALKPVLSEVFRVLSDGYFFFDEEPFKRWLKVVLYKQDDKIYSERARRKNKYLTFFESFISEAPCDETEYGIIENNKISLAEWLEALSSFSERDLVLASVYHLSSKIEQKLNLRNIPNLLLGGQITGLCGKVSAAEAHEGTDLFERLGCPDCKIPAWDGSFDRPALIKLASGFKCPQCEFTYPCQDDIIFLLPRNELQQLYPEVWSTLFEYN